MRTAAAPPALADGVNPSIHFSPSVLPPSAPGAFPVGGAAGFVETDALAVDGPSLRAALGAADDAAYALQVGTCTNKQCHHLPRC